MTHYDTLDDYTADVQKARDAYRADQAVAAGLCGTCQRRKKDGSHRQCWTCRHPHAAEARRVAAA